MHQNYTWIIYALFNIHSLRSFKAMYVKSMQGLIAFVHLSGNKLQSDEGYNLIGSSQMYSQFYQTLLKCFVWSI